MAEKQKSSFCVFPSQSWAKNRLPSSTSNDLFEVAVKHHQWLTVSFADAHKIIKHHSMQSVKQMPTVMSHFQLNNRYHDPYNEGCYDEFYFITALYGYLQHVSSFDLSNSNNETLLARLTDTQKF